MKNKKTISMTRHLPLYHPQQRLHLYHHLNRVSTEINYQMFFFWFFQRPFLNNICHTAHQVTTYLYRLVLIVHNEGYSRKAHEIHKVLFYC